MNSGRKILALNLAIIMCFIFLTIGWTGVADESDYSVSYATTSDATVCILDGSTFKAADGIVKKTTAKVTATEPSTPSATDETVTESVTPSVIDYVITE